MLIEKENFISNDLCDFFIRYHNINSQYHTKHRNTSILDCEEHSLKENFAFKLLIKKLSMLVENSIKNTLINYSQIVKWPTGEHQDEHIDFDYHTATSVLYLNDEYEGGHTVVGDTVIKPKKGKIILRKKRQNVKEGETNLMDERAITEAEAKRLLEKKRLKRELKINKMIEGL